MTDTKIHFIVFNSNIMNVKDIIILTFFKMSEKCEIQDLWHTLQTLCLLTYLDRQRAGIIQSDNLIAITSYLPCRQQNRIYRPVFGPDSSMGRPLHFKVKGLGSTPGLDTFSLSWKNGICVTSLPISKIEIKIIKEHIASV